MFLFISSSPEPEVNLQDRYKTSLHVFVVARYRLVFKVKSESEVIGQHFHDANTAKAKITFPVGAEDNPRQLLGSTLDHGSHAHTTALRDIVHGIEISQQPKTTLSKLRNRPDVGMYGTCFIL